MSIHAPRTGKLGTDHYGSVHLLALAFLAVACSLGGQAEVSADVADAIGNFIAGPMREPHPAIVQVLAKDHEGIAKGSGSLVYADAKFGYILTNWHVVRDGIEIDVKFPDGFSSSGTTVKTDENWDLALVRIWKPQARPLLVAAVVPVPGDVLTIAGYGQDKFRAARGKCIHYAAPDANRPFEMVEVSVEARQGDSGGPILNQRGELAGVLFGAGDGATTGSHIGRVKTFLDATFLEQQRLAQSGAVPAPEQLPRRQAPPPYVPPQSIASRESDVITYPNPRQQLLDVPSATASANDNLTEHGPIAQLGKPQPIGKNEVVQPRSNPSPPSIEPLTPDLVQDPQGSDREMRPGHKPNEEQYRDTHDADIQRPSEPDQVASANTTPVPLPILSVPAAAPGQPNRPYGAPGFTLDRTFIDRLFEATKSVFAIIGAIAVIFQFAKSSLRKKTG